MSKTTFLDSILGRPSQTYAPNMSTYSGGDRSAEAWRSSASSVDAPSDLPTQPIRRNLIASPSKRGLSQSASGDARPLRSTRSINREHSRDDSLPDAHALVPDMNTVNPFSRWWENRQLMEKTRASDATSEPGGHFSEQWRRELASRESSSEVGDYASTRRRDRDRPSNRASSALQSLQRPSSRLGQESPSLVLPEHARKLSSKPRSATSPPSNRNVSYSHLYDQRQSRDARDTSRRSVTPSGANTSQSYLWVPMTKDESIQDASEMGIALTQDASELPLLWQGASSIPNKGPLMSVTEEDESNTSFKYTSTPPREKIAQFSANPRPDTHYPYGDPDSRHAYNMQDLRYPPASVSHNAQNVSTSSTTPTIPSQPESSVEYHGPTNQSTPPPRIERGSMNNDELIRLSWDASALFSSPTDSAPIETLTPQAKAPLFPSPPGAPLTGASTAPVESGPSANIVKTSAPLSASTSDISPSTRMQSYTQLASFGPAKTLPTSLPLAHDRTDFGKTGDLLSRPGLKPVGLEPAPLLRTLTAPSASSNSAQKPMDTLSSRFLTASLPFTDKNQDKSRNEPTRMGHSLLRPLDDHRLSAISLTDSIMEDFNPDDAPWMTGSSDVGHMDRSELHGTANEPASASTEPGSRTFSSERANDEQTTVEMSSMPQTPSDAETHHPARRMLDRPRNRGPRPQMMGGIRIAQGQLHAPTPGQTPKRTVSEQTRPKDQAMAPPSGSTETRTFSLSPVARESETTAPSASAGYGHSRHVSDSARESMTLPFNSDNYADDLLADTLMNTMSIDGHLFGSDSLVSPAAKDSSSSSPYVTELGRSLLPYSSSKHPSSSTTPVRNSRLSHPSEREDELSLELTPAPSLPKLEPLGYLQSSPYKSDVTPAPFVSEQQRVRASHSANVPHYDQMSVSEPYTHVSATAAPLTAESKPSWASASTTTAPSAGVTAPFATLAHDSDHPGREYERRPELVQEVTSESTPTAERATEPVPPLTPSKNGIQRPNKSPYASAYAGMQPTPPKHMYTPSLPQAQVPQVPQPTSQHTPYVPVSPSAMPYGQPQPQSQSQPPQRLDSLSAQYPASPMQGYPPASHLPSRSMAPWQSYASDQGPTTGLGSSHNSALPPKPNTYSQQQELPYVQPAPMSSQSPAPASHGPMYSRLDGIQPSHQARSPLPMQQTSSYSRSSATSAYSRPGYLPQQVSPASQAPMHARQGPPPQAQGLMSPYGPTPWQRHYPQQHHQPHSPRLPLVPQAPVPPTSSPYLSPVPRAPVLPVHSSQAWPPPSSQPSSPRLPMTQPNYAATPHAPGSHARAAPYGAAYSPMQPPSRPVPTGMPRSVSSPVSSMTSPGYARPLPSQHAQPSHPMPQHQPAYQAPQAHPQSFSPYQQPPPSATPMHLGSPAPASMGYAPAHRGASPTPMSAQRPAMSPPAASPMGTAATDRTTAGLPSTTPYASWMPSSSDMRAQHPSSVPPAAAPTLFQSSKPHSSVQMPRPVSPQLAQLRPGAIVPSGALKNKPLHAPPRAEMLMSPTDREAMGSMMPQVPMHPSFELTQPRPGPLSDPGSDARMQSFPVTVWSESQRAFMSPDPSVGGARNAGSESSSTKQQARHFAGSPTNSMRVGGEYPASQMQQPMPPPPSAAAMNPVTASAMKKAPLGASTNQYLNMNSLPAGDDSGESPPGSSASMPMTSAGRIRPAGEAFENRTTMLTVDVLAGGGGNSSGPGSTTGTLSRRSSLNVGSTAGGGRARPSSGDWHGSDFGPARGGGKGTIVLSSHMAPPRKVSSTHVIVQIIAVAIDGVDRALVHERLQGEPTSSPFVPGRSFCGRILDCGIDVKKLRPGDLVFGLQDLRKCGALAEFMTIDQDLVATAPESRLSAEQVAALPATGVMVHQIVQNHCMLLPKGSRVLILNAHDNIGLLAMQEASRLGLVIVAQVPPHTSEGVSICRANGAAEVVTGEPLWTINVLHESSFSLVIDTIGGRQIYDACRRILASQGQFVTCFGDEHSVPSPTYRSHLRSLRRSFFRKDRKAIGYEWIGLDASADCRSALESIKTAAQRGVISPRIQSIIPIDDAPRAFDDSMDAGITVVRVS